MFYKRRGCLLGPANVTVISAKSLESSTSAVQKHCNNRGETGEGCGVENEN